MPRSKALTMKKRTAAPKKIVIKPFSKPPTLPADYYETTSRSLLEGTMRAVFVDPEQPQTGESPLSSQNCYTQVVHLVSHQYGPRLYLDLIRTLRRACREYVLPDDGATRAAGMSNLLSYIQDQYQRYVEYLLLCKHIFLPLDRSHAWCPDADGSGNGTVICNNTSGKNGSPANANGPVYRIDDAPKQQPGPKSATASFLSSNAASAGKNIYSNSNSNSDSNSIPNPISGALMGLWQVGLEQFRRRLDEFNLHELVYQRWWESLQLDWDENLALDQQRLLQTTLYMWQDLGVLSDTLAKKLEPDLVPFFTSRSQDLKNDKDRYNAKTVILYCHSKWMHVAYRWSRFLPKSTCVTLLEVHLFRPHLQTEWLLDHRHFDPLVETQSQQDTQQQGSQVHQMVSFPKSPISSSRTPTTPIQKLWMLAGRLPGGLKLIAGAISQYARSRGLALTSSITDSKMGKQRIADLLILQSQMQMLLSQLPQASDHCSLKSVWEDVVNPIPSESSQSSNTATTNLVAESLAKYVDLYLRDKKQMLDSQWASKIVSGVFSHLQAKDVFEAFYKRDLAKRLLWNRIVSNDIERLFVSLLKAECGAGYTSKMEGMFQDINWSSETMTRYKQATSDGSPLGGIGGDQVDMDIQVLTTGYWPVYPQYPNIILPESLQAPQERFSTYYNTKYQGRRMTWQYALGHVSVRFQPSGKGKQYDLIVSLCQALVLIQFNQKEGDVDDSEVVCTLPQLMTQTGIDDREEMERLLQSLSLGKDGTRVLQKRDFDSDKKKKTRMNVDDRDTFVALPSFHSKTRRIRITNIMMKESKAERDKTVEAVSRDRLYLIDAVLVRIMKARKTISHQQLMMQVLEQVKVPAQPSDVKKRIESLIEREYLERDSDDRNRYNYLA